jgi:hypothetical protein
MEDKNKKRENRCKETKTPSPLSQREKKKKCWKKFWESEKKLQESSQTFPPFISSLLISLMS